MGAFRRARINERRMIARAYYNEIDPAAAHVLRDLANGRQSDE